MLSESYYLGVLVKFAFLGGAAGGLLWAWKRRGIKSTILYLLSSASFFCFVVWLAINGAVYAMAKSPTFRPMIYHGPPAVMAVLFAILVLWPYIAAIGTLILLASSYAAQPGEHRFLVPADLLMQIGRAHV